MRPPPRPTPCNPLLLYQGKTTQRHGAFFRSRAPERTGHHGGQPDPVPQGSGRSSFAPSPWPMAVAPTLLESLRALLSLVAFLQGRPSNLGMVYTKHRAVWSDLSPCMAALPLPAHGQCSPSWK